MNQNVSYLNQTARAEYHSCFKCRFEAVTVQGGCPRCGRPLYSATNIRVRGAVLLVVGLFLSGLMSTVTFFVSALLLNAAKNPQANAKLNDEPHVLVLVYIIFGGVIAMGLTSIFAGLWQIVCGRRNMFLIWIFMTLLIVTLGVGAVFRGLAS